MPSEDIKRQGVASDPNSNKRNRCSAIEALVDIETLAEGKICVVLAEGWENVLPQEGEDDPGALIMWEDDNVDSTVAAFNAAIPGGAVPPPWLNVPITRQGLKVSILEHVRGLACGNETCVVGNSFIGPNTLSEFITRVTQELGFIGFNQFFRNHAVCPIGHLYVLADGRANATAVANPLVAPPDGSEGVQVFA